jgi:hypothetical protein
MSYNRDNEEINFTGSDFEKMKNILPPDTYDMVINTINAINHIDGWNFLREFNGKSFMMSANPQIYTIKKAMSDLGYTYHSPSSLALTLRHVEYLAKHGKNAYLNHLSFTE